MKKKLSLIFVVLIAISLVLVTGCGGGTAPADTGTSTDTGTTTDTGAATDNGTTTDTGTSTDTGVDTSNAEVTIRMGAGTGADNPMMTFMERFKEYAETQSNGRIAVQIYPFGQLGTNAQNVQAVSDGSVEMYMVPSNYWAAIVPGINAITLPGLFDDSAHAIRGLKADTSNMFEADLNAAGVTCLGWCFLNDYILATNKDMSDISKLKGQKIWSNPGPAYDGWLSAMGATPSLVDVGEMVTSIQNGTLDGSYGGMSLFKPFNIQSVCKNLYVGPNVVGVFPVMANLKWLNGLPDDLKQIVIDGSNIVCYDGFGSYNSIYDYGAQYQIDAIALAKGDGMNIIQPSDSDWTAMRAAMDSVTQKALQDSPVLQPYYDKLVPLAASTKQ